MNNWLARTAFVGLLAVALTSCSRITSSGIPEALKTDALLKAAGKPQGITLLLNGDGETRTPNSIETEFRYSINITSGTSGQLLAAFQKEVERTIIGLGGKTNGAGTRKTDGEVRDFSFDYHWGGNDGIIRVYSFTGTAGDIQVILLCYEYRG